MKSVVALIVSLLNVIKFEVVLQSKFRLLVPYLSPYAVVVIIIRNGIHCIQSHSKAIIIALGLNINNSPSSCTILHARHCAIFNFCNQVRVNALQLFECSFYIVYLYHNTTCSRTTDNALLHLVNVNTRQSHH